MYQQEQPALTSKGHIMTPQTKATIAKVLRITFIILNAIPAFAFLSHAGTMAASGYLSSAVVLLGFAAVFGIIATIIFIIHKRATPVPNA
jgi:hypothetical protein